MWERGNQPCFSLFMLRISYAKACHPCDLKIGLPTVISISVRKKWPMGGYTSVGLRSESAATPATLYYIIETGRNATVYGKDLQNGKNTHQKSEKGLSGQGNTLMRNSFWEWELEPMPPG